MESHSISDRIGEMAQICDVQGRRVALVRGRAWPMTISGLLEMQTAAANENDNPRVGLVPELHVFGPVCFWVDCPFSVRFASAWIA